MIGALRNTALRATVDTRLLAAYRECAMTHSSDWNEEHLRRLVSVGAPESDTVEYKQSLPDKDRTWLKHVVGFANARGGTLVIGVSETADGHADSICGYSDSEVVNTELKIREAIRSNTEPEVRISSVERIGSFKKGPVWLVHVPKSFLNPHRLRIDGHFYYRQGGQSIQLSVERLRDEITRSNSVMIAADEYRRRRIANSVRQCPPAPIPLSDNGVCLHVIPADFQGRLRATDPRQVESHQELCVPLGASSIESERTSFGYEGYVSWHRTGYFSVRRDGVLEVAAFNIIDPHENASDQRTRGQVAGTWLVTHLTSACQRAVQLSEKLDLALPQLFALSLFGVRGAHLLVNDRHVEVRPFMVSDLLLPLTAINNRTDSTDDLLRPSLDVLWQSAGLREYSPG